jgi:tetratricopeptide (TPR) repeat protein
LAFFIDTSRRFMAAGPDIISSLSVAFQLLLAVGVAGGVLTRTGREMFSQLFGRWPPFRWAQVRLLLAVGLLLAILAFRITLPGFAVYFNNQGREKQRLGEFHTAQRDYERAIQLQPELYEAHYNLGLLHEEMLDYDAAVAEYQYAWKGGLDVAYNNAARLQILMGRPAEAVSLLQEGLKSSAGDAVNARLLKNLGWAWVELGAHADALPALQQALALESEMAAAHCLSAIALDGLEREDEAVVEWNECIRLASNGVPEEVRWRLLAQEKLRPAD